MTSRAALGLAVLAALVASAAAIYVPGFPLLNHRRGEEIVLEANSIKSVLTQLPYNYYSLPLCPPDPTEYRNRNFGNIFDGDSIAVTNIKLQALVPENCTVFCERSRATNNPLSRDEQQVLKDRVTEGYAAYFLLDNMPVVQTSDDEGIEVIEGVPLGYLTSQVEGATGPPEPYINNHFKFHVLYHFAPGTEDTIRVIGLTVETSSHQGAQCDADEPTPVPAASEEVWYTYSVVWEETPLDFYERWNPILEMPSSVYGTHVKTFIVSLVLVALLIAMVIFTLCRTVRDVRHYNAAFQRVNTSDADDDDEEANAGRARRTDNDTLANASFDDQGWKAVHGNVFRAPARHAVLAVLVGIGAHLAATTLLTFLFAAFGVLSPARRGSGRTAFIFIYFFTGILSGFVASRTYKMFRNATSIRVVIITTCAFPVPIAVLGLINNFVLIGAHTVLAIPFWAMMALLGLWIIFGAGNWLGRFLADRHKTYQYPCETDDLVRPPRAAPWFVRPVLLPILGGLIPFSVLFVTLHYLELSIWTYHAYYLYGFVILSVVLVALSSAAVAIIVTYFFLCWENHKWWWRAFLTPASSGLYVFVYLIFFLVMNVNITSGAGVFMFLVHAIMLSCGIALLLGSLGFLASLLYVWRMFKSVKFA